MASSQYQDENKLFQKWQKTGDKKHFQDLYQSMKPLLNDAASKAAYGSNLPQSAHEIYAAQNFHDALKRFDPSKGVALQTFVYNTVHQKAKRLNYQYQNLGKIPEPRAMRVGDFNMAKSNLTAQLGREPSSMELANTLGWSLKDVENLEKEIQRDLSISGLEDQAAIEGDKDMQTINFLYYELPPEQQLVLELVFGLHGKPRLRKAGGKVDYTAIARATGFSESKLRVLWKNIQKRYEKVAR